MSKKALTIALKILFAVVYFLVFLFLIDMTIPFRCAERHKAA